MRVKNVLVILPTYNERENVEPIIAQIFKAGKKMAPAKLSILVVDDKSPDGTGEIVRRLMKSEPNLHLITGEKQGLGKAYSRGFSYGLKRDKSYDAFVMMDADFSHDPSFIPELVKSLAGSDYVIGSRYVEGGAIPGDWPIRRIFISRVANWTARFLIGFDKIKDTTGGFKALRASALKQIGLSKLNASGYFFQVNLLHEFWSQGFRISEVPIKFVDRQFGVSKMRLRDVVEFIYLAYRINPNSRVRKLIRFVLVGACGTVVNLLALHFLVKFGGLHPQLAIIFAIELSIISNFVLNHKFTFRFDRSKGRPDTAMTLFSKLIKYNLATLAGAIISYLIFTLCYSVASMQYLLADLMGIAVATAWNYLMSTKFVWKVVDGV